MWLRLSALGVRFHYEAEVFFDYRVRPGSMIQDTRTKEAELKDYIFDKPALRFLRPVRDQLLRPSDPAKREISGRELVRMLAARIKGRLTGGGQGPER